MSPVPHLRANAVSMINASRDGRNCSVRIRDARIVSLNEEPHRGDCIIDLRGDRLYPGLLNAHDHLQLNNFPRLRFRDQYRNVGEWIADVGRQRQSSTLLKRCEAIPREDRLLVGGIKNLLCGVTTVAHHDPWYPSLLDPGFPVRVVQRYGWSHSLLLAGDAGVQASYQGTPSDQPWMIHAAEGVDELAAAEFDRLNALGCVGQNTLLIHGLALSTSQQQRLMASGGALIWCPSSNQYLFDRTVEVASFVPRRRVALGTDSRLSGAGDLLDELRVAQALSGLSADALEAMVTADGADLLRLNDRGRLEAGLLADLLILPRSTTLTSANRVDVRMVMVGGAMRYGDDEYARQLPPPAGLIAATVDGASKVFDRSVAMPLIASAAREPGLSFIEQQWRRA